MEINERQLEYIETRNKTYFVILTITTAILFLLVARDNYLTSEFSKLDDSLKLQLNAFSLYSALFLALIKYYPKFYMINFMVVYLILGIICSTGTFFSLFSMEYGLTFYAIVYIGISILLSIASYKLKDYERKVCDILYGKKNKHDFMR